MNLLRSSRVNPKLSAHAYIFGNFDYNRTPIVPTGTRLIAHSKPTKRTSWALHGNCGWSIGLSPENYCCIEVHFSETQIQQHVDTVTFFSNFITFPEVNLDDFLQQAATDIVTLLSTSPSTTIVSFAAGDSTQNTLL